MKKEKRHASWWQLSLLLAGLGGLAFVEVGLPLSASGHRIVEVGLVLAVYGLIYVWVQAKEVAWLREMQGQVTWRLVARDLPGHPPGIVVNNGDGPEGSEWRMLTEQGEPGAISSDQESRANDA